MNPFEWLFETTPFQSFSHQTGWTAGMLYANLAATVLVTVAYATVAVMLTSFRWRGGTPRLFRDQWVAMWFAGIFGSAALAGLGRTLSFFWPAYRFVIALQWIAGIVSWVAISWVIPLFLKRDMENLRAERHDFANKVNSAALSLTLNTEKMSRVAEMLIKGQQELAILLYNLKERERGREGME